MEYAGYLFLLVPFMSLALLLLGRRYGFFWCIGFFGLSASIVVVALFGLMIAFIFQGYPRL